MSSRLLDMGRQYFLSRQHFAIKNNLVVQISTMTQVHLNHVVICHVHQDILSELSCQDITKEFVKSSDAR